MNKESSLTIKWWGVLLIILALIGYLFLNSTSHGERIIKLEEEKKFISISIGEIKATMIEIQKDIKKIAESQSR